MAVKIRLARGGAKKRPFYRVVVANATAPRDGDFLEKVGTYNPMLAKDSNERVVLKADRVEYWLKSGAKPTDRVAKFIEQAGIALPEKVKKEMEVNEEVKTLEALLHKATQMKVTVKHKKTKGSLTIHYSSLEDLDKLCQILQQGV